MHNVSLSACDVTRAHALYNKVYRTTHRMTLC